MWGIKDSMWRNVTVFARYLSVTEMVSVTMGWCVYENFFNVLSFLYFNMNVCASVPDWWDCEWMKN